MLKNIILQYFAEHPRDARRAAKVNSNCRHALRFCWHLGQAHSRRYLARVDPPPAGPAHLTLRRLTAPHPILSVEALATHAITSGRCHEKYVNKKVLSDIHEKWETFLMPKYRKPHRGAGRDPSEFARAYVRARVIGGFSKDMRVCLRGMRTRSKARSFTHAYFPALAACCGMLEYLAGLSRGRVDGLGWPDILAYAENYLPQPDYDRDAVRVLFHAFRNPVAHRGIASGVWVDQHPANRGRRLTWKIHAQAVRPALSVVERPGALVKDPPWPCRYTHRAHIYLRQLWRDIRDSADRYAADLVQSRTLQRRFYACMERLYPH